MDNSHTIEYILKKGLYLVGCGFILSDFLILIHPQALQGQMTGHQTAIDTLRKTAESLITSEGDLLSNPDEIQETVGEGNIKAGSSFYTVYASFSLSRFKAFD